MLELAEKRYENAVKNREAAEGLGRRERRRELPAALEREASAREELRIREQARDRHGSPGDEARRECQIARQVLGERAGPAILAARLAPPSYVVRELGERPGDPEKALESIEADLTAGSIVVFEPSRIRVRSLPLAS